MLRLKLLDDDLSKKLAINTSSSILFLYNIDKVKTEIEYLEIKKKMECIEDFESDVCSPVKSVKKSINSLK